MLNAKDSPPSGRKPRWIVTAHTAYCHTWSVTWTSQNIITLGRKLKWQSSTLHHVFATPESMLLYVKLKMTDYINTHTHTHSLTHSHARMCVCLYVCYRFVLRKIDVYK